MVGQVTRAIILFVVLLGLLPGAGRAADAARQPVLAVLGDSLTAGYGLPAAAAFPARLEDALRSRGRNVRVVNGGVSGDTSAGGRARLDWLLADRPDLVLVELGANDALRGIDPAETFDNLDAIVGTLRRRGIGVLLAGMLAPPNMGREFGEAFRAVFQRVATRHDVPLYPFFLDGVAAEPSLNQPDGIHPTAEGVDVIVARILPSVEAALDGLGDLGTDGAGAEGAKP
jgi:acyl-CoA thioesterase-1